MQLARNEHLLHKQRRADRGLTPQQWQHFAPHLLRLAAQLPLKADVQQLVAGEAAREEVRRFVEDPPLQGEPGLPRLQDYWPPPAVEPGCQVLRPEEAVAAAGMAAGAGKGAAARVAAGGQRAAGRSARSTRRPAPAPAPAPAAAMLAGATSAGSLAEDVIDLTLSDNEDEGSQVGKGGSCDCSLLLMLLRVGCVHRSMPAGCSNLHSSLEAELSATIPSQAVLHYCSRRCRVGQPQLDQPAMDSHRPLALLGLHPPMAAVGAGAAAAAAVAAERQLGGRHWLRQTSGRMLPQRGQRQHPSAGR